MQRLRLSAAVLALASTAIAGATSAATVIGGSSLLTPTSIARLEGWLGEGPIKLTRIYAKQPGHFAADFHAAADGKGRTFTVIELLPNRLRDKRTHQFDNPAQVIGGYNPQSWRSSFDYGPTGQNITPPDSDRNAFIFNLTTEEVQRQRLIAHDTPSLGRFQTYNYILHGPNFGLPDVNGDIFIDNDLGGAIFENNAYGEHWSFDNILAGNGSSHSSGGSAQNPAIGALEVFSIVAVPEPTSSLLALLGLGTIGVRSRRRESNSSPPRRNRFEQLENRTVLSATFGSAMTLGSTGTDSIMDVAVTASDERLSVGAYSGTVDFAPGALHGSDVDILTASGASDAFFAKYADDGSLLWARSVQGTAGATSVVRSVATDVAGNSYLAGDFTGTITLGAFTLASAGDRDGFAAKVDADGNVVWATRWGTADKEYANGVGVDAAGNLLAVGTTSKYSASGSLITTNLQVRKLSDSGTQTWAKQIGNAKGGDEQANAVTADAAGNVYVTGKFKGKVDFDPGTGTRNITGDSRGSAFALKLTSAGAFSWVSPFLGRTSASNSSGNDVVVDAGGGIIVGGYYSGSVDFDPGTVVSTLSTATNSGFLTELNAAGSFVWAQKVGGAVNNVVLDSIGNIYATGDFTSSADFDPGPLTNVLTSNGSSDVYVAKFSSTGAYQWAVSAGGTGMDLAQGVTIDSDGDLHVSGSFRDTVDLNPDPLASELRTSAGAADGFLITLQQS